MIEMAQLDLRGLPIWDRPDAVFEAFDKLPEGEALIVVTENEPRGLAGSLRQQRDEIVLDQRRVGWQEWHVELRHSDDNGHLSPLAVVDRSPLFRDLPLHVRQSIAQAATQQSARRGRTVVEENMDWPNIGLVVEGTLALASGESSARNRILYEISAGETFAETEFFDGGRTLGRVIILSKTARFLTIPREIVCAAGTQSPQILISLAKSAAQRVRTLAESLTLQATQPILVRIASALLPYATADRGLSPALAPLPNMTQAQIAAAAGTVKEVAARAIAELEQRSLLKRERGHICYLDRQLLLEFVRTGS